jgi:dipeptidyl aminopeptidase/acylaminoacyl peptidase
MLNTIERADTRKREGVIYPVLFLPGTDHALATHDDDNGFSTLYEIDLTTQKDLRTVYAAGEHREIADVETDPGATTLLRAIDSGADAQVHWFDPALADLQAQFDKAVGGDPAVARRATIVSLSRDRKRMLVRVDRPDTPGGLYYYNVDAGTMNLIGWYSQQLAGRRQSPVTLVHYQARDGLPIEAVLTLPKGRAAKNLPIVMLPHGGPWAQDELAYDYWAQFIASLGYAVLQPNFRGSTGYGTTFLLKGEGQMGLAMQDDITDGLRWAVAQGIADPKRACIVGASYGGYAAMWGIAKDPDLYRCAIAIAGVASLRREVNDFGNELMQNKYTDDWKRMTPDFLAVSPINAIPAIKAPLLLIHGEKDVTVDVGQSKSMYKRMLAAGKQVQFVDLPLADHHFGREADRKTLLSAMGAFLAKYNPADAAPAQLAGAGMGETAH